MCPPFAPSLPAIGMSTNMTNTAYLQLNSAQQMAPYSGIDMGINSSDVGLRRSISGAVSVPEMFTDSSCFAVSFFVNQSPNLCLLSLTTFVYLIIVSALLAQQQTLPSTTWEADLQNLYNAAFDQAGSTSSFPSQPFTCN